MNGPRLTQDEIDRICADCIHGLGPSASGALRLKEELELRQQRIDFLEAERDEMHETLGMLRLRMAVTRRLQAMESEGE